MTDSLQNNLTLFFDLAISFLSLRLHFLDFKLKNSVAIQCFPSVCSLLSVLSYNDSRCPKQMSEIST